MTSPNLEHPAIWLFSPLEKVSQEDDGSVLVNFTVSTETPDDQGEIVDFDAVRKAAADYMQWANLREMHQPSAVGTTLALDIDEELRKVTGVGRVVDPVAAAKVMAGVYKGVSIGGRKLASEMTKVGGKSRRRVTEILWNELSLADRPSNPDATLTLMKRSESEEIVMAETSTATPDEPAEAQSEAVANAELETADGGAMSGSLRKILGAFDPVSGKGRVILDLAAPDEPETPIDDLAKAADPAAPDPTTAAPVAGGSADPTPADGPPAADPAPDPEPLAKSAADDVVDAHMVIERITRLIETETAEGDGSDVADLRAALEAMQRFAAGEAAEVGTPEDQAQVKAEEPVAVVVVNDMYYAAVTGDLAKRALELRKAGGEPAEHADLDQLVTLAMAAGGRCGHELEKATFTDAAFSVLDPDTLAKVAGAAIEQASDALMRKVSEAIGAIARPDDLVAVKAEILGALGPMKEELAKIASQPTSGGPLRYAHELRRFADGGSALTPELEAEVLSKAAQATNDPAVKEALGLQAAAATIRAQQGA